MAGTMRARVLRLLDLLFHLGHVAVILFSALGWLIPAARPLHLALQALVMFSWFGLGSCKGWTYCFLTDLHWRVKRALHQPDPGESYVKLLVDRLSGRDTDAATVNRATVTVFFVTTALSLLLFLRDRSALPWH
jgi:hypothetical protein